MPPARGASTPAPNYIVAAKTDGKMPKALPMLAAERTAANSDWFSAEPPSSVDCEPGIRDLQRTEPQRKSMSMDPLR